MAFAGVAEGRDRGIRVLEEAVPYYRAIANEKAVFRAAWLRQRPTLIKGPTGCGKTRLVEHMATTLGRELLTVACHEDLTAADLLGRFLLKGGETVWIDGPLTRAVRCGGICYLDEIVEARADCTVVIHSLADYRRELFIERLGERLVAPPEFMLVVSYNPGYQSILKDLKPSTRQRMVAIELDYPEFEGEIEIVMRESGVARALAEDLVRLAGAIRQLDWPGLPEVSSTRSLIAAGALAVAGLPVREAVDAGMIIPLCDDTSLVQSLRELARTYLD